METISLRIIRGGHELTTATWLHLPPEVSTIAPELSVKTTKNKQKKHPKKEFTAVEFNNTKALFARIRVKLNEKVLFR